MSLEMLPQPPVPPTTEQIAREILAWLIEGKEIGLHAVAVKLALSRQDDEVCWRWAEQARAYLRKTGQEEAGDTDTHESVAPPTLREIEDALLAWAIAGDTRELRNGDPVCMALLGITDRLVKSREGAEASVEAPSRPATPSGVVREPSPRQDGAGDDNGWADIAASNARLLTQAIEKLTAAERELARFEVLVRATRFLLRDHDCDADAMPYHDGCLGCGLEKDISAALRQRDAAGRGEA